MDLQTKQQVRQLCSYWKWGGLLMGIFSGSAITQLLDGTQGTPESIPWIVVKFLCLLGGVALVFLARRKYDTLVGKDPSTRSFLRLG